MKFKSSTKIILKFQVFTISMLFVSLILMNTAYFWMSLEDHRSFYDTEIWNNIEEQLKEKETYKSDALQSQSHKKAWNKSRNNSLDIDSFAWSEANDLSMLSLTWETIDADQYSALKYSKNDYMLPLEYKWKYWNHIKNNCFYIKKLWNLCLNKSNIFYKNIYKFSDQYFYIQKYNSWTIAISFSDTMNFHINLLKISIIIFIVYVIVSYFFWYLFLRTIYSKVYKAVNELKENNYINLKNYNFAEKDELRIFFKTINDQIDSISSFNKYLSHELKTPLMNISSSIDLLNIKYKDPRLSKMKEHIFYIKDIIDTLNKLILLENKKVPVCFYNVDICSLTKYYAEKINLKINIDCDVENIKTSKELFSVILKNILDNAKKYSKSIPEIKIRKDYISFTNKTDIDLNIPELTKKFYKQWNNWMWIWLYLVNKIVWILNYDLNIEQKNNIFTIKISF